MSSIEIIQGDITKLSVDAIVNAANSSLMGGGGVDGAIHRAGGPQLLEECKKIIAKQGSCRTGEAVITTGGKLPAKFVIHTVGPVWHGGQSNEAEKLAACYTNSLTIASNHTMQTIAFPNISTGIYGYPKKQAAEIALRSIYQFLKAKTSLQTIFIVCFDDENFEIYKRLTEEG